MATPNAPLGQCKCCLKTTYLKNMWEPQEYNGNWEVYGQMLVDCFGIDWTIMTVEDDNICQVCISKLRVATAFKHQIQDSQATILEAVDVTTIEDVESTHRVQVETIPTLNGKEVEVTFVPTTPIKIDDDVKTPLENQNSQTPSTQRNLSKTYLEKKNNTPLGEENLIPTHSKKANIITDLKREHEIAPKKKGEATAIDTTKENQIPINLNKDNTPTIPLKKEASTILKTETMTPEENKITDSLKKEQVTQRKNSRLSLDTEIETPVEDDKKSPLKKNFGSKIEFEDTLSDENEVSSECDKEEAEEEKAFEDVEFLEEDFLELEYEDDNDTEDFEPETKKPKRAKGKPRGKRKTYKNYTEEDVMRAVEAVCAHEMSRSEASRVFKVPRETIGLKAQLKASEDKPKEDIFMKRLIKTVRALLTYTNVTPFKVSCQGNNYKCFFCIKEEPVLQLPKDLRLHTQTQHLDKIKQTEFAVRPRYLNQMVRVDIHNLKCECNEEVTWENMLEHLQKVHGVTEIDEAWKNIVPYDLNPSDIQCVFESCDFSGCFNKLDTHMNKHFPNYLCGVCGRPFVTDIRLKSHNQLHEIGEYRCFECPQVFQTRMKRKMHRDKVHGKKLLYRCTFCSQRFETISSKMSHLRTVHADMVKSKGKYCNLCGISFWTRDFTRHMKFEHNKHMCHKCGKRFDRATRLKAHECNPESPVKNYKCAICMRLFFTKDAVLVHISQKHNKTETEKIAYLSDNGVAQNHLNPVKKSNMYILPNQGPQDWECD